MRQEFERLKEAERNLAKRDKDRSEPPTSTSDASRDKDDKAPQTNPSDLLPKEGADEAAKQIDEYNDRFQQRRDQGRFRDRDPNDERDR